MTETIIKIIDQFGIEKNTLELVIPSLKLTVRELINLRVYNEFTSANIYRESAAERVKEIRKTLNGKSNHQFIWMGSINRINPETTWEEEAEKACNNFQSGLFIVISGGNQLGDLDEEIILGPEDNVQFIRLVPLIGG